MTQPRTRLILSLMNCAMPFGKNTKRSPRWADVVISNGVLNLMPDKLSGLQEMARVLKPGGRLQIADILVEKPVPDSARREIDLWTG